MRHLRLALLVGVLVAAVGVGVAEAKITIRRHAPTDAFFFHGNYSTVPFSPDDGFGVQIWNCAGGEMPEFIADRQPLVVCGYDADTGFVLADLVYEVALPPGACDDHGRSCYYRDPTVPSQRDGIRYFRIRYARRGRGNRVWLDSYGDLSAANQSSMMIVIKINGGPRAILQDVFTPLPGDGWFSRY